LTALSFFPGHHEKSVFGRRFVCEYCRAVRSRLTLAIRMPGSVQTCRVDYNRPLPQGPLSHPGYGRIVSPPHLAVPARGISGARRDAFWLSPFVPVESMTRGRQIVCMQIASHPIKIPRRIFTPREILLCTALLSCVAPRTMWAGRQELLAVLPLPESHPFFGQFALVAPVIENDGTF
jgi:hypothetical protein